jgi:succinate-acetate transporter protein
MIIPNIIWKNRKMFQTTNQISYGNFWTSISWNKVGCGTKKHVFEPKPRKKAGFGTENLLLEENLVLLTRRKPINIP